MIIQRMSNFHKPLRPLQPSDTGDARASIDVDLTDAVPRTLEGAADEPGPDPKKAKVGSSPDDPNVDRAKTDAVLQTLTSTPAAMEVDA